jgi:hypothetical protein
MENWVNGTITEINETDHGVYYSIQSRNPLLSNCEPTILFDEVKVRIDSKSPSQYFSKKFNTSKQKLRNSSLQPNVLSYGKVRQKFRPSIVVCKKV